MLATLTRSDTPGPQPAIPPPCVLVVDDDDVLRLVLARELRRRGFEVYSTASGAEAVELYCRWAGRIDLVLMDVNMPGTSGPAALGEIRAADPTARCCFMTADVRPETRAALLAGGALAVFGKPFGSLAGLCESLRQFAAGAADRWDSRTPAEARTSAGPSGGRAE